MSNQTTISVHPDTLEKFQKVHRIMADNPSESYNNTLNQLLTMYIDFVIKNRANDAIEVSE
jgi:hypothetical protein